MVVTILLCYAHQDERIVGQLKNHLSLLEQRGLIALWDYGNINPGAEWKQEIDTYLNQAQIILLLISAEFLASNFRYKVAMQQAIGRHERGEVRVIPILLRPALWDLPPLDKLQVLPDKAKPITDWHDRDKGFENVARGIMKMVEQWNTHNVSGPIAGRRILMEKLDQLIETIKLQMQPQARAIATASTLQQLSIFIPNETTLADLVVGWQHLSRASQQEEERATIQRRVTCGELANLASQFTTEQGNVAQASKTWHIWRDAFENSDDPRQSAMARTFTRELAELQAAIH